MVNPVIPRRVAVIRHMAFEDTGVFGELLAQQGWSVSTLDAGIDTFRNICGNLPYPQVSS